MNPPLWLGSHWLAPHYIEWLIKGALLTAWLSLLVCAAATLLGILFTALQRIRWFAVRWLIDFLLSLHRNTPLMVQLLLWYFGFSGQLPDTVMQWLNTPHLFSLPFGLQIAWPSLEFLIAFVALTLYSASFIAEELRAGIRGVEPGQFLAALALGMTRWQAFYSVVLPQALVIVRRPLIGQYTAVIKNTSLTMAIGVAELSYTSRQVETETLLAFQAFAIATVLYLLMVLSVQYTKKNKKTALRVQD